MKEIDEDRQEFSQNAETQQLFIHSEKNNNKTTARVSQIVGNGAERA